MKALQVLGVGVLLLSLAGCGGAPDSVGHTVPVKGKVMVDGKLADHGSVALWPDAAKGNASKYECTGDIAADGTYTVYTKGKAGAPPGAYKVTVAIQSKVDSTDPKKAVMESPKKYQAKDTSPLAFEVVEKPAAGAYDLDLK